MPKTSCDEGKVKSSLNWGQFSKCFEALSVVALTQTQCSVTSGLHWPMKKVFS